MPNLLEIKNLNVAFGSVKAVSDFSIGVKNGEFFCILGPSGCGKSSLLHALAGVVSPTSGEIILAGTDITYFEPQKRDINTVFQRYALFNHLSVFENVAFGLRVKSLPKEETRERVSEALTMVKLADLSQRKPLELSGGQMQRLAIARAIVNRPKLLLLDEPSSALDKVLKEDLLLELKSWQREANLTIMCVTHDQDVAISLADRLTIMDEGILIQEGAPDQVYENPVNRKVMSFLGASNILAVDKTEADSTQSSHYYHVGDTVFKCNGKPSEEVKHLGIRPSDLVFNEGSSRRTDHSIPCEVKETVFHGDYSMVILDANGVELRAHVAKADIEKVAPGMKGYVGWKPGAIKTFTT